MVFKKFLIKRGNNSSGSFFSPFLRLRNMVYKVVFNKTCLYRCYSGKPIFQNNLFGFKFGFMNYNSAEFSWSCNNEKILLGATYYRNGTKHIRQFCELDIDKFYILEIKNLKSYYEFIITDEIEGSVIVANIRKGNSVNWGFRTFPNFRTFAMSLQDMEIHMKEL